jgi:DNA-binding winged helix-turn-helix (wHTH) protein
MRYAFGRFTLDVARRQLFCGDEAVHLSPKALQLLQLLIEERPNALAKRDLHDRLWPETFVVESNLAALVNEVRRALGDNARRPELIRTVHGYGYAFSGEAVPEEAQRATGPAAARLVGTGSEVQLYVGRNIVGRDPQAAVHIDDRTVSRRHAAISISPTGATVEDLGSKNGTFIDGARITTARPIRDGAEIGFGSVVMTYRTPSDASTTTLHLAR